jgi:predicted ATPase/DNA-binding winged helix-turn-helix (wHTH) protein
VPISGAKSQESHGTSTGDFQEPRRGPRDEGRRESLIRFGRFQLDDRQGLSRGSQEVRLTPKSLAVLCYLARHPGQVVSKDELFRAVWPDTAVSDAALTSCIQELRRALRDDPRHPRHIQTVHRRGYRLLGPVAASDDRPGTPATVLPAPADSPFVGRKAELQVMRAALSQAEAGTRQFLFVSGEPGMGKTALVRAFLQWVAPAARGVGWGQCVERHGVGEPYHALLEAIGRLCRQPNGAALLAALRRCAPTWLAQLPSLLTSGELTALQRRSVGVTRERMMRELTDALETIATETPVVLSLEDLHWSDVSTIDWIASFARRPEPARFLLIGTYRPTEPRAEGTQPLSSLLVELRVHRLCQEITLTGLQPSEVESYIQLCHPPTDESHRAWTRLASLLHGRTAGVPLFIVNVMTDLVAHGQIVATEGRWSLRTDLDEVALSIPRNVRRMLERQLDQLRPSDRELLDLASVVGDEFSAASVVDPPAGNLGEIEGRLQAVAETTPFLREAGVQTWPDGTAAAAFAFPHSLYRRVIQDRLAPTRRAELHLRAGLRKEAAYGGRVPEIATELAEHFELGRDLRRAVVYRQHAGETARRRGAYREAHAHFMRALDVLERLEPSSDRDEREIELRVALGTILMATRGWGAPEVEAMYTRARELCRNVPETRQLFPALWGMWLFHWGRGSLDTARELADDLLLLARRSGESPSELQALHASWATCFSRGELEAVETHTAQGLTLYDAGRHFALAARYGDHDAGVCGRMFRARASALAGRTREAVRVSEEAIALARDLQHPASLALALLFAATVHQIRSDASAARTFAAEAAALAAEQNFSLMRAWARTLDGWATVQQGGRGRALMEEGIAAARTTGSDQFQPYSLALLADTCRQGGSVERGLQAIAQGLEIAHRTGERFYEPELHRLAGELRLISGHPSSPASEAEGAFRHAVEIARGQGAWLLALRAAVSLTRLTRRDDARVLLRDIRAYVDDDPSVAEIREAATL